MVKGLKHMGRKARNLPLKSSSTKTQSHRYEYEESENVSESGEDELSWWKDVHTCGVCTSVLLAIYLMTVHPSIPGGDSGELIVSAYELGVAHPPGYPLFTLMSKLATIFIPFGSVAWRVNVLNTVLSALAGGLLQMTVLRITGCVGSSLLSLVLFSLSKLTWTWASAAEVFGLNNVFVALLLYLAVMFEAEDSKQHVLKYCYAGVFVCGLALCNQHTIVVYVCCLAIWVLYRLYRLQLLTVSLMARLAMVFSLGLTPYLYLPLSAHLNVARWTWGDQRTLGGLLTHLLRREYGTFDLGKGQEGIGFIRGLGAYMAHAHINLCELGPFLCLVGTVVGLVWLFQRQGSCVFLFSVMLTFYATFFAWRANLDLDNPLFRGVVERFWMQSDLVMSALAGVGCATAVRLVTEQFLGHSRIAMSNVFAMMGAGIVLCFQMWNFSVCNHSRNMVVHDFAKTVLQNMPQDAIVLTKGDLPTNSLRYLHLVENLRPDLQILDVEILSYEWSLPMIRKFYPQISFPGDVWQLNNHRWPDGRQSFNFKSLIDANYKRHPLIACIGMQERDASWKDAYHLLPFGVCSKIHSVQEAFDPVRWANRTGGFADTWKYKHNAYDDSSWEEVANDEMWHAKISTAFYMYQQGEQHPEPKVKVQLLAQAYELYFRAIKINQKPGKMASVDNFPTFWHKNFALACEKLLHLDQPYDQAKLCKLAMTHFRQYLHLEPGDKDADGIREAVNVLQQRLNTYLQLDKVDLHLEKMANRADQRDQV